MYLKAWSGDSGRLQSYRVLVPHSNEPCWKPRSPKAVAYHRNLYTRIASGGETDDVETWFDTEFETPAGKPFKRALNNEKLSPEDWWALVRFLAAQDVRTPARMFDRLRNWNETLPALIDECLIDSVREMEEYSRAGVPIPTAVINETQMLFPVRTVISADSDEVDGLIRTEATIGRSMWLWSLKHLLTNTLKVLHAHRWTILRSPPGIEWLTSDNPVLRLNYSDPETYDFKGGWGSIGTQIMMPLSPTHLLYTQIGAKRPPPRGTVATPYFASQVRRFTVEHAHRYVFGRTEDPDVEAWRPRTVDSTIFQEERRFWESWNAVQTEAELSLFNRDTGSV